MDSEVMGIGVVTPSSSITVLRLGPACRTVMGWQPKLSTWERAWGRQDPLTSHSDLPEGQEGRLLSLVVLVQERCFGQPEGLHSVGRHKEQAQGLSLANPISAHANKSLCPRIKSHR